MDDETVSLEKHFRGKESPAKLYAAIVDFPGFVPEPDFEFRFTGGPSPEKQYLHLCRITDVVPEKRLTYSWRYDGCAGNSFVTFELKEEKGGTRLRLTHSGIETFPKDNPDLAKNNFVEGWNHIVNISLKNYLEGSGK